MEKMFNGATKTGEIVTQFPRASQILKEYRLDFCCGGNRPIHEAIAEKNLNEEEILSRLNTLYVEMKDMKEREVNWELERYSRLIDHILDTHHAYLDHVLTELNGFVTKVYRVHGSTHPELSQVHRLFHRLKLELEEHLIQEEEKVFPKIKAYEAEPSQESLTKVLETIAALEEEHEEAGHLLKELRSVTRDYTLPEGACTTYTLMYLKLEELESDLFQHIHLENNILFPRLERERANVHQ
ncbi:MULTISPECIES: iron-sulfur cluster repair di-iron protein [Bacillaceae]|uniref:iron-sulfur cluster repair di-iron protein n=1 Tax=Bacillales TaxID=1385 RepID=UPI001883308D|nr:MULTISPECIES: iron-sulfur cluster repair di-iron protein [Bacillaceae]MBF0707782.1 iron-sulfur cluster repair di-iron protein [Pseudalkalibacillus hwajinpoensis]MDO6654444.1 iron-sulfur cluster repair di-iron protein [Anaerobacillus sp. 1_MG-2023]